MLTLKRIIVTLCLASLPVAYASAAGSMQISLVPHCTEQDRSLCPAYEVLNATEIKTGTLVAGDILDIDVVVQGSDYKKVRSVRSWLEYDPSILEGRSVEITSDVTSPTPGEQTFDAFNKLVKIGGEVSSGFSTEETVIARVTFRVTTTTDDTRIRFNNYREDGLGHTAVNGPRIIQGENGVLPAPPCIGTLLGCKGTPEPLLFSEPSALVVSLKDETVVPDVVSSSAQSQMASSTESSIASSQTTSALVIDGAGSTFGILQVQGLRATTKDTSLFLGWNDLKSSALKGYNVYYGTVSGRYLQRRSVPATPPSLVIRDLEVGTTYYMSVRGVNNNDEETVFSQEVSITIGRPETASSPLVGSVDINQNASGNAIPANLLTSQNGQSISGSTGVSDTLFIMAGISAVIGTFFAFRRQLLLSHHAR